MPVYAGRRPGTWRVTVWSKEGQKEWIVKGTKQEAKRYERLEQAKASEKLARVAPTFSDFCLDLYEPHARAELGVSTWNRARRYIVTRLVRHFGRTRLDRLDPVQVERYKRARQDEGLLVSSLNAELAVLRGMLRWAGEVMKLPVANLKIKGLKDNRGRRVKVWSTPEVALLFESIAVESPHILPMVRFMLNTGVRKGEAIACEWTWIDFGKAMLRIPVTAYWRPKDKEPREVPIDGLIPMLTELPRVGSHVFVSSLGRPYTEFPQKTFTKAVKAAGLTGGPHQTRHTFASHFLQAQPDLGLLSVLLGHSQTQVTEIYAHMLPGHLNRARGVVNLAP